LRKLAGLVLALVGLAAVSASAANLVVNGGTLQTLSYAVEIPVPASTRPLECRDRVFDKVTMGTEGDDRIQATGGRHLIMGLGGDDLILGSNAGDCIDGGPGNDKVYGLNGDDILAGGAGEDRLFAGAGDDIVDGGDGNDACEGGSGADALGKCESGAAPRDLHGWAEHSEPAVSLAWTAAQDARFYNVYRADSAGGPYSPIGSSEQTSYRDGAVEVDVHHYYVVTGVHANGYETEPSNEVLVEGPDPPSAPSTSLAETPPSSATATVTGTPTARRTPAPSTTATSTPTRTPSPTPSPTPTPVCPNGATPTATPSTVTPTPTPTPHPICPTATATATPSSTPTPTSTPTAVDTPTLTPTPSAPPTSTAPP
jgi:hypothetical protein